MTSIKVRKRVTLIGWISLSTVMLLLNNPVQAQIEISQTPLVASGGAPDNLLLLPSIEYPTMNSVANLGSYSSNSEYGGYFDPDKCYGYQYDSDETKRYFYPLAFTTNHTCPVGQLQWSGNFLNWATTQTIDPFRSAMTGGYRVKDTTTETWLEKARHDGQGGTGLYPNPPLSSSTTMSKATPFSKTSLAIRIQGLGNKMRFSFNGTSVDSTTSLADYNPSVALSDTKVYELSVRVKVCVPNLLEQNCKQYGSNYKPEGVLQEYSGRLRYGVIAYLNDSNVLRDGAVLRASQKSIGPYQANINNDVKITNPLKEWDAITGVLYTNPSPTDASATSTQFGITIQNSGVINAINKMGQLTTQNYKSYDPVSELYYSGLRYLRNKGNVSAYSSMSGATTTTKFNYADGFPVVTNWTDPFQAYCQANAILGIGDIYSHRDKNLPGNTNSSYRTDEPSMPSEVSADNINVLTLTNQIGRLEGLGDIGSKNEFSGRYNSAHIAGLAWYANTRDIRPDLPHKQTISTYWVDVLESQSLEGIARNQYVLAAKYGGFKVPEDFNPDTWTGALPTSWWNMNGETLTPFGSRGSGQPSFKRPDNYYVAGEARQMAQNLKKAFASIVARVNGSGAGLASNSTKLVTGSRIYQSMFYNKSWHGDVKAFDIDAQTGAMAMEATWSAIAKLPAWGSRKIYTGSLAFNWANLNSTQKAALGTESVLNYLRGDSSNEQRNGGTFRDRFFTPLGDIVQSQPVLVGRPNAATYTGKSFNGAGSYASFANAQATRTPVVYVGANDGMLHGFDANTGVELYAFMPDSVIQNNIKLLTDPYYSHRYFLDGELTVADVYINSAWKTVLVGTLGRAGKGIFALDITDPNNVKFLWEKNGTTVSALGNNLGKPVIAQTSNGVWQVIVGNGPNSTAGNAQFIMINLQSGTVTTVDTGGSSDNGLSAVAAWSSYGNGITDLLFAGDLQGNMWRLPVGASSATKLFVAKDTQGNTQPISVAPLLGTDPDTGKLWLFFGTGRYLSNDDMSNNAAQTWYGLKDATSSINRNELVKRSILVERDDDTYAVRVTEVGTTADLSNKAGWYIDLPTSGERMVVSNIFQQDALIGTVRIPNISDMCQPTGRGFIMAINPFAGARLDRTFFDLNGDGEFDEQDQITINGVNSIVSGIGFDSSPNSPIFIGNVMYVVKDNGLTNTVWTQGADANARRTAWREVVNQ